MWHIYGFGCSLFSVISIFDTVFAEFLPVFEFVPVCYPLLLTLDTTVFSVLIRYNNICDQLFRVVLLWISSYTIISSCTLLKYCHPSTNKIFGSFWNSNCYLLFPKAKYIQTCIRGPLLNHSKVVILDRWLPYKTPL